MQRRGQLLKLKLLFGMIPMVPVENAKQTAPRIDISCRLRNAIYYSASTYYSQIIMKSFTAYANI